MSERPLKIGYIWQYEARNHSQVTATALHIRAVVEHLQKKGHSVRVVTLRDGGPQWSDDLENWRPVPFQGPQSRLFRLLERVTRGLQSRLHLPYFNLFDSYRFSLACAAILGDRDVFYERFWLLGSGGLMAARRLGIPHIYEVNGDINEEYSLLGIQLSKAQWRANYLVTQQMFQKAARVIAVSETLREQTIHRWDLRPQQVTKIENGAHVDLFVKAQPDPVQLDRYGLNNQRVVMFIGSFKPWHGLDLLVEAFGCLSPLYPQAKLVLVGDGPQRAELEAQVESLGLSQQVVFTGVMPHTEVASLLSAAQVAVLNPRVSPASESQSPLKLFEYMAAGKAVVAPAIPNMQRLLEDRINALLIPPNDADALCRALKELLDSPEFSIALGQAAKRQALERHSWAATVAQLEEVFYDEIDRRRAASERLRKIPA